MKDANFLSEQLNMKGMLNVEIHHQDRKKIPFGKISSRNGVANIFSYFGDRDKVSDFMQKGSHLTRIYFINEAGLKGFLVPAIVSILEKAIKENSLQ